MRILAISDLRVHDIALVEEMAARMRPDLIVYAGDDVARFGPGPNSWGPLAARIPLGLAGVIGNDCRRTDAIAFDQPGCHDLDRAPLLLDGLAILGLGGAPRDEGDGLGATLYSREQASDQLSRHLAMVGRRRVLLVSHAPPLGVLDIALRFGVKRIGSSVVREFLRQRQIRAVVCGHVHSQGGQIEEIGRKVVVNIASNDHPGADLRGARLDWDGENFAAVICIARDPNAITRVRGVGPSVANRLINAGFRDIPALLLGDGGNLAAIVGTGPARAMRAHARALHNGVPVLLEPAEPFPKNPLIIDVETSSDKKDDPWLVGMKRWDSARVRQFQELDAACHADHLGKIGLAIERFIDVTLIRWGSTDRWAIEQAHIRVGLDLPPWLALGSWFDAGAWVNRVVALPIDGGDLKSVARYFGYPFADTGISGFMAGNWYALYRKFGVPFDVRKVRAYNRDDVFAVEHVVRAVKSLGASTDVLVEPRIGLARGMPMRGGPPGNDVADRAVAKYAAALAERVASGELLPAARDRAVAGYAAHMRRTHGASTD